MTPSFAASEVTPRRRRLPSPVRFGLVWSVTFAAMLSLSYLDYRTVGLLVTPWNLMFGGLSVLVANVVAIATVHPD